MPTGYEVQMYRDLSVLTKAARQIADELSELNDRLDAQTRIVEQGMTDLHDELVEVKNTVRAYSN